MDLIDLRDELLDTNKGAHERIRRELAIYRNEAYTGIEKIGRVKAMAKQSIDPKIRKGVNRLIPGFQQNAARIEVQPDKSSRTEFDIQFIEDIQNWLDMNDDATDEAEDLHVGVMHNLALGNHVCKIGWDHRRQVIASDPINPLNFFVHSGAKKSNFSDCDALMHRELQTGAYLKRNNERLSLRDFTTSRREDIEAEVFTVDEIWMRPWVAGEYGIGVEKDEEAMVIAIIINNKIHRARLSRYWWPDYPFVHWRNFLDVDDMSGKAFNFWGHGYGHQLWENQKLLDEMLANLVLISRNQSVGRFLSVMGALDMEQVLPIHGLNIEIDPDLLKGNMKISDVVQHLPPDQVPAFLGEMLTLVSAKIDEELPSMNPVYTGEQPAGNPSGRAVNSLQFAAFSQLSDNITRMNEFRLRRARIKVTMLQQYARRPLSPHAWRGGIDLPDRFEEDARHVGYHLTLPDTSQMPNTPAGRMQVVMMLANMGLVMAPERILEFVGLDRGFGLKASDFMQVPIQMPGTASGDAAPGNQSQAAIAGLEAAMSVEK